MMKRTPLKDERRRTLYILPLLLLSLFLFTGCPGETAYEDLTAPIPGGNGTVTVISYDEDSITIRLESRHGYRRGCQPHPVHGLLFDKRVRPDYTGRNHDPGNTGRKLGDQFQPADH